MVIGQGWIRTDIGGTKVSMDVINTLPQNAIKIKTEGTYTIYKVVENGNQHLYAYKKSKK